MKRIKLLWEYKGQNAKGIADHQVIHLQEYCIKNKIKNISTGTEKYQEHIWFAYLILNDIEHSNLAKDLKPRFLQRLEDA